jgi:hypothetical protein
LPNDFHHAVDIAEHVVIPKSQNPKVFPAQMVVAQPIRIQASPKIMLSAIDLDHYARREARKSTIIWSMGTCRRKMKSGALQRTQVPP